MTKKKNKVISAELFELLLRYFLDPNLDVDADPWSKEIKDKLVRLVEDID